VILSLVFLLAKGIMMSASSSYETLRMDNCFQEAWGFGTEEGGEHETQQWYWMNGYYTMWCM
jgi:hypothetical protein